MQRLGFSLGFRLTGIGGSGRRRWVGVVGFKLGFSTGFVWGLGFS